MAGAAHGGGRGGVLARLCASVTQPNYGRAGTGTVRHSLQVPQHNGSVAEQGAEQGARAPGRRPASREGAPLPGLAARCCLQVTVSAAGDAETGGAGPGGNPRPVSRPGVPAPSQVFMRVLRPLRLPRQCTQRGAGGRGLRPTPQLRSRGPADMAGRLGYCSAPPAPLTSQPRPPTGLEPLRP